VLCGFCPPPVYIYIILFFLWRETPLRQSYFVYPHMSGKPQTYVKRSLQTNRVILWLRRQADSKELFSPKEIRILNLIEILPGPRPLPLEPTSWGLSHLYWLYMNIYQSKQVKRSSWGATNPYQMTCSLEWNMPIYYFFFFFFGREVPFQMNNTPLVS